MKSILGFLLTCFVLFSCDEDRVYEKNIDFDFRYWTVSHTPEFEFEISDSLETYNLYCNLRNSLDYPYANIFITYYLQDSTGALLEKDLVRQLLFDEKTGEPFGESGLGDIYDHQIPLKTNYQFPYSGKYKVVFEQFMRSDTLRGVLAVGLRVERTSR